MFMLPQAAPNAALLPVCATEPPPAHPCSADPCLQEQRFVSFLCDALPPIQTPARMPKSRDHPPHLQQGKRKVESFPLKELSDEMGKSLVVGNDLVAQKMGLCSLGGIVGGLQTRGKNLRRLDVAFNNLTTLGYGLGDSLPSLRSLSVYSNRINSLDGLRGLSRLETLRLQHNAVPELNDAFLSMRKLRELRLDYNSIQSIDHWLLSCSSLETLDLSSNRISSCEGLSGLQSLASLRLAHNLIRSLLPLRALPSLIYLDVSYNKVSSLTGIENIPGLEVLIANDNGVKTLMIPQTYSRPRQTENLSAASSSTSSLGLKSRERETTASPAVLGMSKLTELYLCNNLVSSLEGLDRLGVSLELLDLAGNRLQADENVTRLFLLKRLEKLNLAPIKCDDEDFMNQLTIRLKSTCPHLESFDSQSFLPAPLAAVEAVSQGGESDEAAAGFSSDDNDDDENDDGSTEEATDKRDNKHNERFHAPTLSLKDMKTAEEVLALENDFKILINSCKETLFTILSKPDEAFLAPPAKDVNMGKKLANNNNDSIELAASLFHFSSVVPVEAFRETLDNRGTLARPSLFTTSESSSSSAAVFPPEEKPVLATSLKKPFILTELLGLGHSLQDGTSEAATTSLPHSPSSSSKGSSKADSKRLVHAPLVNSHLGSGLTLHGTRIRNGTSTRRSDPILDEMLQRFVEVDENRFVGRTALPTSTTLPFGRTSAAFRNEVEEAHQSYSFLTAPPQEKTVVSALHDEQEPRLATGGSFRGCGAGFDARGTSKVVATVDDLCLKVDAAIGSLRRRRFSESQVQQQQQQQRQPDDVDDSDDDNEGD